VVLELEVVHQLNNMLVSGVTLVTFIQLCVGTITIKLTPQTDR
jgi:hypothetical protein